MEELTIAFKQLIELLIDLDHDGQNILKLVQKTLPIVVDQLPNMPAPGFEVFVVGQMLGWETVILGVLLHFRGSWRRKVRKVIANEGDGR